MTLARRILHAAALSLVVLAAGLAPAPLVAQSVLSGGGVVATDAPSPPDYESWGVIAGAGEKIVGDPSTSNLVLESWRSRTNNWRNIFQAAQSANKSRIEAVQAQLDALGAPPADGVTEVTDITQRRNDLAQQLADIKAPGQAADEAYQRAEGIIRQIDTTMRQRQADALLRLGPAPVNPTSWPAALTTLGATAEALMSEVSEAWASPNLRAQARGNLPLILGYLLFAVVLLARGRRWIEQLTLPLMAGAVGQGRRLWTLVVSLGQIALPMLGLVALAAALRATGAVGPLGDVMIDSVLRAGFVIFLARWLAGRLFPKGDLTFSPFRLLGERRAEGRFLFGTLGVVMGLNVMRRMNLNVPDGVDAEAANAVLVFPLLVVAGLALLRLGKMLRLHARLAAESPASTDGPGYQDRLAGVLGRLVIVLGVGAPLLAAIGYVPAATALLFPAVRSLWLIAALMIVRGLLGDLYALVFRQDEHGADGLVPVLAGFVLTIVSLPFFALIWGVRQSDLAEMWSRFRAGFSIGGTHISPSNFLTFAMVFGVGYMATRLVQGALRGSLLPKTRLDRGGQNAVIAGTGYLGIFFAAVIAITSAGIDLSGLALVASALTVGIGFGLQNIVSNFVSGIILLVERPVSEGDWIEVGSTMGTVRSISVRSTRIETFDRTDVIVPNSDLIIGVVTNWTRFSLNGRLIVPVGVAYGTDTRKVERILLEIANAQPLVVVDPAPTVTFEGFGTDSLEFKARMILRDVNLVLTVKSDVNHEIARRFAEEGIELPFAQRDIWLRNPEALRAAAAGPALGNAPGTPAGSALSDTAKPGPEDL